MTLTSKEIRKSSTSAWSNRAKSSAKLMQITVDATLHAMGDSGDWTVLAHHIKKGLDNGAPSKEMANIKLIAMSIADGMTMKKDEAQPTGIKISMKKAVLNDDAISKVDALVARRLVKLLTLSLMMMMKPNLTTSRKLQALSSWAIRQTYYTLQ